MDWLMLAFIGALLGLVIGFIATETLHIPTGIVIFVAMVGALGGGLIQRATGSFILGEWTFFIAGLGLSVALLAGALLAYQLTETERRL